ncbi:HAD family hydrolase [Pseudomonas serbica]|uniref:HAD family hydrolase n=1 Tax=Pseudomonas serbica TaxID=2965074 RepID=UPI00237BB77C|nr:HAD family hydrolase [Pseudomonas serbica]
MRGVIFDAFGTLVKIHEGNHPYRQILKLGSQQGRRPQPEDAKTLMTNPWGLAEAAKRLGISVVDSDLEHIQAQLDEELAQITAYPDGLEAVDLLKNSGFKVAVCSNLALPYAAAIERLYPSLDGYSYSFEVGTVKPEFAIYQDACTRIDVKPYLIDMVGDSQRCDQTGPTEFGMQGWYLDRKGESALKDLASFAHMLITKQKSV